MENKIEEQQQQERKGTYIFAVDPGPVNTGWVLLNTETGLVETGGMFAFIDTASNKLLNPKARAEGFIRNCVKTQLKENPFWKSIFLDSPETASTQVLEVLIEDQTAMDRSQRSAVRLEVLALESCLHYESAPKNRSVNANTYKAYFNVRLDDANKRKCVTKAMESGWYNKPFYERLAREVAADKLQHIADATLMARYWWEKNYCKDSTKLTNKKK
jgi:hypothetical protein